MNVCTGCDSDFTSLKAFDEHHVNDDGKRPVCDLTRVVAHGDRKGRPLFRMPGDPNFDWAKTEYKPAEPRPCKTCNGMMAKRPGKGRFPHNCTNCGGTGIPVVQ